MDTLQKPPITRKESRVKIWVLGHRSQARGIQKCQLLLAEGGKRFVGKDCQTRSWRGMKSTSAQAKALILRRIQMLRPGRAINNGAIHKLGVHYSLIHLEKRGTVCTPKSESKYAQNIQGLKTRYSDVPNVRDEGQFAVKDKTQKNGLRSKKEWVAGRDRGQAKETTHVNGKSAQPQSWRSRNESHSGQPKNTGEE